MNSNWKYSCRKEKTFSSMPLYEADVFWFMTVRERAIPTRLNYLILKYFTNYQSYSLLLLSLSPTYPSRHIFYSSASLPPLLLSLANILPFYYPPFSSRSAKLSHNVYDSTTDRNCFETIGNIAKHLQLCSNLNVPRGSVQLILHSLKIKESCIWKEAFLIELHIKRTEFRICLK